MSVIVPVRDGSRVLLACLDALAAQQTDLAFEVVVVDDGSTDGTRRVADAHPLQPRVVRQRPTGAYAARNTGIARARGRLLAFTDADCLPEPGWLAAGVGALAGGADLAGGAIRPTRSPAPTVWERYDRALYLEQREYVEEQGFAATANLFTTAEVVRAVGPFDASLSSSGDLEWCQRAVAAGRKLVYVPDAVIRHQPRTTLAGTWRLHRRLGAGWAALARRGARPTAWRDPALRIPLGLVVTRVAADGPPLRRRQLAPVHMVAMGARVVGRLTGRPGHSRQSAARSAV